MAFYYYKCIVVQIRNTRAIVKAIVEYLKYSNLKNWTI